MKNLLHIASFLFIFSLALTSQAQDQDSLRITGVVMDKDSLEALPFSKFSINSFNFLSDETGQFSMWVKKNEIIKFSHLGFKDTYLQIDDSLTHRNYLFGVFLTRDTVQLSEVIVVPRYQNLAAQGRYMPLKVTPESVYAANNIRQSTNQALTQAPIKMDAEMNQKMVIREQTMNTVYKTQIQPDQMVGLSTEELIPLMLYQSPDNEKVKRTIPQPLTQGEMELLIDLYEQQLRRFKRGK